MVKYFIVFCFIFSSLLRAQVKPDKRGVVSVLEAPLFLTEDENSKVIQYLRKGDALYINAGHTQRSSLGERLDHNQQDHEGRFYKTIDKKGRDAYILKRHVLINFGDSREFAQNYAPKDDTDYRLTEPLPQGYPLEEPKDQQVQYNLGLGPSPIISYPTGAKLDNQDFSLLKEFTISWGQSIKEVSQNRSFFGGLFLIRNYENQGLYDDRKISENYFSLGVGPYFRHTFWKGESLHINASFSLILNLIEVLSVDQQSRSTSEISKKDFSANSIIPHLSIDVVQKDILKELDLNVGVGLSAILPFQFKTTDSVENSELWQSENEESFTSKFNVQATLSAGLTNNF